MAVADAGEAVFIPAVGAGARMLMREIVPGGAVGAVILAHGPPRAFADVWPPALPVFLPIARLTQPQFLFRQDSSPARPLNVVSTFYADRRDSGQTKENEALVRYAVQECADMAWHMEHLLARRPYLLAETQPVEQWTVIQLTP